MNVELIPIIKIFHCNSEIKCNEFIFQNKLLESKHPYDSLWLGRGMYFWDNLGNAKYWKRERNKKMNKMEKLLLFLKL